MRPFSQNWVAPNAPYSRTINIPEKLEMHSSKSQVQNC